MSCFFFKWDAVLHCFWTDLLLLDSIQITQQRFKASSHVDCLHSQVIKTTTASCQGRPLQQVPHNTSCIQAGQRLGTVAMETQELPQIAKAQCSLRLWTSLAAASRFFFHLCEAACRLSAPRNPDGNMGWFWPVTL